MGDTDWFDGPVGPAPPREDPRYRAYAYLSVTNVPGPTTIPNDFVQRKSARDDEYAATVLEHYPDIDAWVLVWTKQRAWLRYWAVAHSTEEGRAQCVAALEGGDDLIARSREHLRKQGLDPITGEPTA
jgi:hypothetical protein